MVKKKTGFTLVELMVVVAIIGILSSIAIPNFRKYVWKSRATEAKMALVHAYTTEVNIYQEYTTYAACIFSTSFGMGGVTNPNAAFDPAGSPKAVYAIDNHYGVGSYMLPTMGNDWTGNTTLTNAGVTDCYINGGALSNNYAPPTRSWTGLDLDYAQRTLVSSLNNDASVNAAADTFTIAALTVCSHETDRWDEWIIDQNKNIIHSKVYSGKL